MTRMSLVFVATAALMAAACNPAEDSAPVGEPAPPPVADQPAGRALTSEGWGPLRIGMTTAEITAALGPDANPEAVGGPDPEACDEFRPERAPQGMLLMTEQGVLTRISLIRGSEIMTSQGYGVGAAAQGIATAYGSTALVTPHKYEPSPAHYITVWSTGGGADYVDDPNARGLVFEVGQDGLVKAIRAGGPSIQYVEGCS
jgi:hypothetical protein